MFSVASSVTERVHGWCVLSVHCVQVAITTPKGGSSGYTYIKAQEKVSHWHTTRVYFPYSFRTVLWVLLRPTEPDK